LNSHPPVEIDPIAVLIDTCLTYLRTHFYQDAPKRSYHRDEQALVKAIARYGHECHRRGWEFEPLEIQKDVIKVIRTMLDRADEIQYLPIYLEGAIDRHIRLRAEELSAKAKAKKTVPALVAKKLDGVQVAVIEKKTTVETLSDVWKGIRTRQHQRRTERTVHTKESDKKELSLL